MCIRILASPICSAILFCKFCPANFGGGPGLQMRSTPFIDHSARGVPISRFQDFNWNLALTNEVRWFSCSRSARPVRAAEQAGCRAAVRIMLDPAGAGGVEEFDLDAQM